MSANIRWLLMTFVLAAVVIHQPPSLAAAAYSGTPYSGSAVSLPGTVQAENFDNGGEGVAYHDTTPGNSGGVYRSTDVDIEPSTDGGYDLGWIASGEWVNYTVNVASAGTYTVQLRVASPSGATVHVGFNGATSVWAPVAIPATGGWQNWTTVSLSARLSAGVQQLTLYFDTAGLNFNSVTVAAPASTGSSTPFSGTAAPIPGTIQAEDFDNGGEGVSYHDTTPGNAGGVYRSTDVDIESSTGGGYDVGWIAAGEWLNYSVVVATSGTYTVQLRVASQAGGTLHVGFNGGSNVWTSVVLPATGGWQNWTTVSVTASLAAGPQLLTLYFDTAGFNVDAVTVIAAATGGGGGSGSTTLPTTATFTPSSDNATNVTSYNLDIFAAGASPSTATPVRSQSLGKPAIAGGQMSANIASLITSLSTGSYFATVTAIGPGGSTRSAASNTFSR